MLIFYIPNVNAYSHPYSVNDESKCVDCLLVCGYDNSVNLRSEGVDPEYEVLGSYIYYDIEEDKFYVQWNSQEREPNFYIHYEAIEKKHVFIEEKELEALKKTGLCPKNGYVDRNMWGSASEVCFDSDEQYCINASNIGTTFKGSSTIKYTQDSQIRAYFNNWSPQITCEQLKSSKDLNVDDMLRMDIISNYLQNKTDTVPDFIKNSSAFIEGQKNLIKKFDDIKKECENKLNEDLNNEVITQSQYDNDKENINNNYDAAIGQINEFESSTGKDSTGSGVGTISKIECSMIRGTKTYKWLQKVFNFIKIIAPILVLGLGTLDFVKAIFSGEEDLVNKAGKKFIKRVIAACAIFLLPILIDWILAFADTIGNDPTCGLG